MHCPMVCTRAGQADGGEGKAGPGAPLVSNTAPAPGLLHATPHHKLQDSPLLGTLGPVKLYGCSSRWQAL